MGILTVPFHITANGVGHRHANWLAAQVLSKRTIKIINSHLGGFTGVVNTAAGIDREPGSAVGPARGIQGR